MRISILILGLKALKANKKDFDQLQLSWPSKLGQLRIFTGNYTNNTHPGGGGGGGGGHSRIKITGMLVGKLESDPLKQTNLGVAQLYFTPKEDLTPFVMFIYEFAFGPTPSDSF